MTISVGELMTEGLETIEAPSSAQEAAKKMSDKKISSLVVIDNNNRPIGIVTECDFVRKVCVHNTSSKHTIIENIMSSPSAADVMIQNHVRHLLVIEDNDINKPLGIITPSDFAGYLKENLNIDYVNTRIIESLKEGEEKES
jgi:CBS domain-containing protein